MEKSNRAILAPMRQKLALISLIVVVGGGLFLYEQNLSEKRKPDCASYANSTGCFMNVVHTIALSGSLNDALRYAVDVVGPHSRNALHMSMHMVGQMAYEIAGNRSDAMAQLPPEAFTDEDHLTYDGFRHGVLQAFFVDKKDTMSADELVKESCGEFWVAENDPRDASPWLTALGCFHGAGHALMMLYEQDMEKSIAVCARLPYYWMQQRCGYGVFMEVSYSFAPAYGEHVHGKRTEAESMESICASVKHLREVCAMFVGHSYLLKNPNDYKGAFDICARLPVGHDQECNIYLAEVIFPGSMNDFQELQGRCESSGAFEDQCLMWIALGLKEGYGGKDARQKDFCASLEVELAKKCREFLAR